MTAALLLHKPAEPCKFLADYLTSIQKQGAQPVLTREELRVMFGMFDVTEKGAVSVAQANQVIAQNSQSTCCSVQQHCMDWCIVMMTGTQNSGWSGC